MQRATSRNLYLAGLVLAIIGGVVFVLSLSGASADATTGAVTGGNAILALVATVIFLVAGVLSAIGYIGALIKLAQLGQWVWFVLLLLFSGITMLIYIFAGPTQPKAA
ncbi:MAG TPA: hypothetical protein VF807_01195 [Ktedonobacterales bacterium]